MSALPADNFREKDLQPAERLAGKGSPDNTITGNDLAEYVAVRDAMDRQNSLKTQTIDKGFELESDYWKFEPDRAKRSFSASQGQVTEIHEVAMRMEVARRIIAATPQSSELLAGIEKIGIVENAPAPVRFPCGDRWYTLTCPLAPETLASLAKDLGLPATATTDQIEKNLHFQFQCLYQKPPDEWNESEVSQWERLQSFIDLEAYEVENLIPENRIGVLVSINADQAIVRWNTDGEMAYDTRDVPAALLGVSVGWTLRAIIQKTSGGEQKWLFSSAEPPLKSSEQVIAEDIASPGNLSLDAIPDADWPKIPPE